MRVIVFAMALHEELYVEEWIDYHLGIGCDHVFLYDNSRDNCLSTLKDNYPEKVTIVHFPGLGQHMNAYNDLVKKSQGDKSLKNSTESFIQNKLQPTWCACIDLDEFIVIREGKSIQYLIRQSGVTGGALCLNWYIFGSNGLTEYENKPVLLRFTRRAREVNKHVKSIVYLPHVVRFINSHYPILIDGQHQHDALGRRISSGPFNIGGDTSVACIHHYHCKTLEEYQRKISHRVDSDGVSKYDANMFIQHDCNEVEDYSAAKIK